MSDTGKTIALIKALAPAPEIDPEQVKQNVEDWLDDHPEATTTVQDGSITKAKLNASLQGTVDDVDALKSALNSIIELDGELIGEIGSYKYVDYRDGKINAYAYESYVYKAELNDLKKVLYYFTNATPNVMGLAFYDKNMTFIPNSGVQALSSKQIISVPNGAFYIQATVLNGNQVYALSSISTITKDIQEINNDLLKTINTGYLLTPTNGYYVDYRDGRVNANANTKYVQFPVSLGSEIQYNSTISIPDVRGIAFYNSYGSFIGGYKMLSTVQTIQIPTGTAICRATVNNADDVYLIVKPSDISDYADRKETYNILSAFENITCVGDSLTWSQVYLAGGNTRKAYKSYPEILGEKTGVNTEELASAGFTASQWWSAYSSDISEKTNQLAIIYLGTNLGLSDTVDTDCIGDDPDQWANTLTADYCRIVNAFKAVGSKIILVEPFITTGANTPIITYSAIESISLRFGCGLVRPIYLSESAYHKYPNGDGINEVHYNDLGYAAFADKLITAIAHMDNSYMLNIIPE